VNLPGKFFATGKILCSSPNVGFNIFKEVFQEILATEIIYRDLLTNHAQIFFIDSSFLCKGAQLRQHEFIFEYAHELGFILLCHAQKILKKCLFSQEN